VTAESGSGGVGVRSAFVLYLEIWNGGLLLITEGIIAVCICGEKMV